MPPSHQQLEDAYAACGGPPIQNGQTIQPTPERDRCLTEHLQPKAGENQEESATLPQPRGSRDSQPGAGQGQH
jgi:hypothetical protein